MEEIMHILPQDIEAESFRIIGEELAERGVKIAKELEPIVKRVIHTTADFEYADTLYFSCGVVEAIIKAFLSGKAVLVTDTTMALSGINKRAAKKLGVETHCFIADEDVANSAKEKGITRSAAAVQKMWRMFKGCDKQVIFVNGNAPTASIELCEILEKEKLQKNRDLLPLKAVLCVPVGFVNVVYAKELICSIENLSVIVNKGRKGGSNVAASIVNALLYLAIKK